ncbi:MAG: hypothetical protein GX817_00625 [Elusimicrobia bacterium]|nr:hypothetical protein [Elusimicrobiota bacterium]
MAKLVRKFKDESSSVYKIVEDQAEDIIQYIVSTRDTRDLMNYPEIVSVSFREKMRNGVTAALKGINHLEKLSSIDSKSVNVFHILRGALNFELVSALNKAFGFKWHSSSYISSQRVLKEGSFEISEDHYRKFVVPDNATLYCSDIVASGVSFDNSLKYLDAYMESKNYSIKNLIFITIGCREGARVLRKWDKIFREKYPGYEKTIICYLEGCFALASPDTPIKNTMADTDLLRSRDFGALIAPEFEYSQFEKINIALEACAIYDGGKKGFEPLNHIRDILLFWEKQRDTSLDDKQTLWDEYNMRLPLRDYFSDFKSLQLGDARSLEEKRSEVWEGVTSKEYDKIYAGFDWLWNEARIARAQEEDSLTRVCNEKIKYLRTLLGNF